MNYDERGNQPMSKKVTTKKDGVFRKLLRKRAMKIFLLILGLVFLLSIGGCSALYFTGSSMIDEKKLSDMQGSVLIAADGSKVAQLQGQNMEKVSLSQIPKVVQDAFISTEDKRFYSHNGIDPIGIGRAVFKDIIARSKDEGASTITQQLARNIFLPDEAQTKSFMRKTKEIMIALNLERKYSKEQILEMYLNRGFYAGHGVFGVQTASKYYFGKPVDQLTLAEAATLAAIPKAPTHYAPTYYENKDELKEKNKDTVDRRNLVLSLMYQNNKITKAQMEAAQKEPLNLAAPTKGNQDVYQAYVDYIVEEAEGKLGIPAEQLYSGAYKIYTYLDKTMQESMYEQFQIDGNFPKNAKNVNDIKVQGAMVILESKTGGITAMMGGRDYVAKGLNRTTIPRQMGSSIKPLVDYGPALEKGWTPSTIVQDIEKNYGTASNPYIPHNYNKQAYKGPIPMSEALKHSLNASAVWTLNEIGLNYGINYLKKFGIPVTQNDYNLATALGGMSKGATPIQMAQAYSAFDNNGTMTEAHAIKKITTADDKVLVEEQIKKTDVISPQTAYYMTEMLKGVVQGGTGTSAALSSHPVAGKTGTTQFEKVDNGNRDAWFVGYTPDYVAAVWMGYDKTDLNHYIIDTGGGVPSRMFHNVMTGALQGKPVHQFQMPEGAKPIEPPVTLPTIGDLSATVVMENNQLKVKVTWTGNGNAAVSYKLYRFQGSTANKQLIADGTGTVYMDNYDPAKMYSYVVVPYNNKTNQEGTMSNMAVTKAPVDLSPFGNNQNTGNQNINGTGTDNGNGNNNGNGTQGNNNGGTTQPGNGNTTGTNGNTKPNRQQ